MRIRSDHRDAICAAAVAAKFDPEQAALEKQEAVLGKLFYEEVLPEVERRSASKLPQRWVERNANLRFTADGATLDFKVGKPLVVPVGNSRSYGTIGILANTDSAKLAIEHHNKKNELRNQRDEARRQLMSMLNSFTSLKQLEEAWPEGKPYYANLVAGTRLPTPTAKRVNEILGLKAS